MRQLAVTISYMERNGDLAIADGALPKNFSLNREDKDKAALCRSLYYEVGEPHFWWERRLWSDKQWEALDTDDNIELWVLHDGDARAGYFELNFTDMPEFADLAFFGLYPPYIGKGLGKALLTEAMRCMQTRSPAMMRVNTCDLDHPAAFPMYEASDFRRTRQMKQVIDDPRLMGVLPKRLSLPKHYKKSGK